MTTKSRAQALAEGITQTSEYRILRPLAEGASSPQDALQQMVDLVAQEIASNKAKGRDIEELAGEIPFHLAEAITLLGCRTNPADQGKLVEFCLQFYRRKECDPDTGAQLNYGQHLYDSKKLWNENPTLMQSVNEAWNFRENRHDANAMDIKTRADDLAYAPERKRSLVNLNAFAAQLTQGAPSEPPYPLNPMHWAHLAIWAPKAAFEGDIQLEELIGTTTLQVACMWFTYAVDAMWACVEKGIQGNDRNSMSELMAQAGTRYEDTKWMGFNKERWDVWVRGLEHVLTLVDASDTGTKEMIETALARAKAVG